MEEIGSYEARVHFSDILRRVERGEEFTVTIRGRPVARITHAETAEAPRSTEELLNELDAFRARVAARGPVLSEGETLKDLVRTGLI